MVVWDGRPTTPLPPTGGCWPHLAIDETQPIYVVADVLQSGGSSVPFASLMTTVRRSAPLSHLVQETISASVPIKSQRRCVAVSTDRQVTPRRSAGSTISAGRVGHLTMGPRIAGLWSPRAVNPAPLLVLPPTRSSLSWTRVVFAFYRLIVGNFS